jgi:hypothetical protein
MQVRAGRVVGVRLVDKGEIQVALVVSMAAQVRWVRASQVLTERQVDEWVRSAAFRPTR